MTKLTLTFEEKDYGADVNVEFEGNAKDVVNAFGSLQYELISKLVEKKALTELQAAGKIATAAFFAPLMVTSPRRGVPPIISYLAKEILSLR